MQTHTHLYIPFCYSNRKQALSLTLFSNHWDYIFANLCFCLDLIWITNSKASAYKYLTTFHLRFKHPNWVFQIPFQFPSFSWKERHFFREEFNVLFLISTNILSSQLCLLFSVSKHHALWEWKILACSFIRWIWFCKVEIRDLRIFNQYIDWIDLTWIYSNLSDPIGFRIYFSCFHSTDFFRLIKRANLTTAIKLHNFKRSHKHDSCINSIEINSRLNFINFFWRTQNILEKLRDQWTLTP